MRISDWSSDVCSSDLQISPEAIFRKLKVNPGHFNMQRQTLSGLLAGKDQSLKERIDWGKMRMDPTDVADVNGSTYTFLVNGHGPRDKWTALFSPGERVRPRIVNASAMTILDRKSVVYGKCRSVQVDPGGP